MKDLDEMKLARVILAAGRIDGRVKMQKIVYLLQAMGYDLPFDDFRIRQYGPFSRAVACATDILKGAEFVTEEPESLPWITNEFGEPGTQFCYRVREDLEPIVRRHYDVKPPCGKPSLEDVVAELNSKNRAVLEVAATRVYLEHVDRLTGNRLDDELRNLKGHLLKYFPESDEFVKQLKQRQLL